MRAIVHALSVTGSMTWQITWALILGFALSAVIQAVVRRSTVVRLLGDARPRTLAIAAGLGAASSSCSYAAVALARALFRKGADFTAAMAFEIASTNLVIELGVILALLMGWQFTLAEFTGGPLMIVFLAVLFRLFLRGRLLRQAREQADRGLAGSMEGHAAMDMSVKREGSFARRLLSGEGFTSVSHVFVMEWAAIIRDLVIGLLVAGAIAAWVPDSFWHSFFFAGPPAGRQALGAADRPGRGGPLVRLLDRERAAGRGAVEGRDQLRRRDRVHLRRPDHRADPEHLPQVLRAEDGGLPARHVLRGDGRRRVRGRADLRRPRADSRPGRRHDPGQRRVLGLHDLAEHRLPAPGRRPGRPVHPHRRRHDAEDDGRRPRTAGRGEPAARLPVTPVSARPRPTGWREQRPPHRSGGATWRPARCRGRQAPGRRRTWKSPRGRAR